VTEALGPIYRPDGRSWLIDPPVGAYAAARLYLGGVCADTDLLRLATLSLEAIDAHRRLTPDGAAVLLHPLESGADVSPLFDVLVDVSSRRALLACHKALSTAAADAGYEVGTALARGHAFIVSDPIFCGWHLLALEELAKAWREAGAPDRAARLEARAESLGAAMVRDLWSPELNLFVGYDHVGGRPLATPTLGGIIAAASRYMIRAGYGAKVVAAHLDPEGSSFWGPRGIAFNPLDGLAINPRGLLWRGDVVWGATQYWGHLVLSRNGQATAARLAGTQMAELIADSGFREYYSAVTGEGHGAGAEGGFTWPALVLDMTAD
jgi:hypothetical protein